MAFRQHGFCAKCGARDFIETIQRHGGYCAGCDIDMRQLAEQQQREQRKAQQQTSQPQSVGTQPSSNQSGPVITPVPMPIGGTTEGYPQTNAEGIGCLIFLVGVAVFFLWPYIVAIFMFLLTAALILGGIAIGIWVIVAIAQAVMK